MGEVNIIAPEKVQEAFLISGPQIAESIIDLTIQSPSFLRDVPQMEAMALGAGTIQEQIVFRGAAPQIEEGFDHWKKLGNLSGCSPCEGPECSYNWTTLGGFGFERRITEMMTRDYRSPSYCIKEIQTTAHFEQVFAKIVENLHFQIDFIKQHNIIFNAFTGLAKKFVGDGAGLQPNTQNPYVYRSPGTITISSLNIDMLEFLYERMRRMSGVIPYDVVDGAPIYALMASHQLLARLYRDDPNLRQDVRFSGLANDLLMKYNFMSTIRGMFIAAPILYPRRFNLNSDHEFVRVLPFVNGVPAEVGAYSELNPAYEDALYEEVLIHGRYPFKILYMPTATTLGSNTSFGPEFAFMNSWQWVNPQTVSDPARREGFFMTSATIGIAPQFSEGIFGIIVPRPNKSLMYVPGLACVGAGCDGRVPDVSCPCPVVLSITAHPLTANHYFVQFATPTTGSPSDPVVFALDNGTTITGTLVTLSTDGLTAEINFTSGLPNGICTNIVSVSCTPIVNCSAVVIGARDSRSGETGHVELTLQNSIVATAANAIIYAYFGDCTTQHLKIISVDSANLTWTVAYATGYGPTDDPTGAGGTVLAADMIADRGGVIKVCVPTSTNAACPSCTAPTFTACENPT